MRGAGVEHGLRRFFNRLALLVRGFVRPGEVVVDDLGGVAVVAFQASADIAHPSHVHG